MKNLTNEELKKVNGGGISLGVGLLIAAGVVFLIGAIDGYVRPLRCN
ncbi:MAG: class IIb bacteriocin, lactobin A/cerein 7B family [Clostridium sp.]|nr:class IIb bacteriocin, lactobin A/cerein 7B family [Clostridium sp.]MCM1444567.1 class IIb bacteriocin, lactobin A/cerein 7B family [Candidatus Amulumruptor caecigallinarius]